MHCSSFMNNMDKSMQNSKAMSWDAKHAIIMKLTRH